MANPLATSSQASRFTHIGLTVRRRASQVTRDELRCTMVWFELPGYLSFVLIIHVPFPFFKLGSYYFCENDD